MLEVDTIKHVEMKEKEIEENFGKRENDSKPNYIVEISSKA